jgi:hypothetical protein
MRFTREKRTLRIPLNIDNCARSPKYVTRDCLSRVCNRLRFSAANGFSLENQSHGRALKLSQGAFAYDVRIIEGGGQF